MSEPAHLSDPGCDRNRSSSGEAQPEVRRRHHSQLKLKCPEHRCVLLDTSRSSSTDVIVQDTEAFFPLPLV